MNKLDQYLSQVPDGQTADTIRVLAKKLLTDTMQFGAKNLSGYYSAVEATTIPTAGTSGYAPGCKLTLSNVSLGQCPEWINFGSATSCAFYPVGPVFGYGVKLAGGPIASLGGDAAESLSLQGLIMDSDLAIVGHEVTDDNDQIAAAISNEGSIDITGSADPSTAHAYVYAALRSKCVPEWDIFAAGTRTAITGDTTAIPITVSGVLATDIAFACYGATDDTDVISKVVCTADTVTITASADPVTEHSFHYVVLRPRGSFKPSHYIAYAGSHTTVGGAAAEAVTVTGAAATDIPIVVYKITNDTDSILKTVMTANTMTVTCSADPSTAHAFTYMLLRAY